MLSALLQSINDPPWLRIREASISKLRNSTLSPPILTTYVAIRFNSSGVTLNSGSTNLCPFPLIIFPAAISIFSGSKISIAPDVPLFSVETGTSISFCKEMVMPGMIDNSFNCS